MALLFVAKDAIATLLHLRSFRHLPNFLPKITNFPKSAPCVEHFGVHAFPMKALVLTTLLFLSSVALADEWHYKGRLYKGTDRKSVV